MEKVPGTLRKILRSRNLHTVCESARCPNLGRCFGKGIATFMIMGDICTRSCGFCAVSHGDPRPIDPDEPGHIAEMVEELRLRHAVITSVTRDDLPDGGASHFVAVISELRRGTCNDIRIEVLTPDFNGDRGSIKAVLNAFPDVFNHNLETVRRLTSKVRSRADYDRSLGVLGYAKDYKPDIVVKSGFMVGLGETEGEIFMTLQDLSEVGCDVVTIGQYLRPSMAHLTVKRYVEPNDFKRYKNHGESIGIKHVFAGPLVRSSYMAEEVFAQISKGL